MRTVIRKIKRYRSDYDRFLEKNRQLKTTIDDNEQHFLQSLTTRLALLWRRWWHRTSICLGLKSERVSDEFNLERSQLSSNRLVWEDTLKQRAAKASPEPADTENSAHPEPIQYKLWQQARRAESLRISKELAEICEALYVEYRERIWQRCRATGNDVRTLDRQIEDILDLYQSQKSTYEKTIKELQALERGYF